MTARPHETPPDLRVLHTLRCVGAAGLERLGEAARMLPAQVESALIDLAVEGFVGFTPGAPGVWAITEPGRAADATRIRAEVELSGTAAAIDRCYEAFLVLNPELLQICSAWQLRPVGDRRELNDHGDHRYDDRVLRRLADLDRRAQPVTLGLEHVMTRFATYRVRLDEALARALGGDHDAVATSTTAYHSVWFQLHEDLLVTLDRRRG